MASLRRITPFRFARHDFYRALRIHAKTMPAEELFEKTTAAKHKAMVALVRRLSVCLLVFLICYTSKSDLHIEIKTTLFTFALDKLYVVFVGSTYAGMSIAGFLNYMILNDYQRLVASRFFNFENSTALAILLDPGNAGRQLWDVNIVF